MPILIKTHREVRGSKERTIPEVPDNYDRYEEFRSRQRATERVAQGNNFPWKWRMDKPMKS